MRIGIDVSQVVYEGTGVARYVREMTLRIIRLSPYHDYILFGGAWGRKKELQTFFRTAKTVGNSVRSVFVPFSPKILDFFWNILHIVPITWFTGPLDVFWSSDWTQPPIPHGVVGITTIHDVSFLTYPESFPSQIRNVQERRLRFAKQECSLFLCDSESTKKDVQEKLGIAREKLIVVHPGWK